MGGELVVIAHPLHLEDGGDGQEGWMETCDSRDG